MDWDALASRYDALWLARRPPAGGGRVGGPRRGDRLLDVGTGTGYPRVARAAR